MIVIWEVDPVNETKVRIREEGDRLTEADNVIHVMYSGGHTHFRHLVPTTPTPISVTPRETKSATHSSASLLASQWSGTKSDRPEKVIDDQQDDSSSHYQELSSS